MNSKQRRKARRAALKTNDFYGNAAGHTFAGERFDAPVVFGFAPKSNPLFNIAHRLATRMPIDEQIKRALDEFAKEPLP